jgi:hypothetical protein
MHALHETCSSADFYIDLSRVYYSPDGMSKSMFSHLPLVTRYDPEGYFNWSALSKLQALGVELE